MTKYVRIQMMGLQCWKCHNATGALAIPVDAEHTPETLGAYLVSHHILPICNSCSSINPLTISFENLQKDK